MNEKPTNASKQPGLMFKPWLGYTLISLAAGFFLVGLSSIGLPGIDPLIGIAVLTALPSSFMWFAGVAWQRITGNAPAVPTVMPIHKTIASVLFVVGLLLTFLSLLFQDAPAGPDALGKVPFMERTKQ